MITKNKTKQLECLNCNKKYTPKNKIENGFFGNVFFENGTVVRCSNCYSVKMKLIREGK